jgi:Alpha-kinase family
LEKDLDSGCALSLLFLSDGAPTDARNKGLTPIAAQRQICSRMEKLGTKFGNRLCIHTIGFGNEWNDFSVLREMVDATTRASKETRAKFIYCGKFSHEIGSAVSSLVTSLTETRTSLAQGRSTRYTMRNIAGEEGGVNDKDWRYYKIVGHMSGYVPKTKEFVRSRSLPRAAWTQENDREFRRRVIENRLPPFLAISSKHCGKGAERFAFRSRLADAEHKKMFVFGAMVAKETNAVERVEENIELHKTFLETQSLASHLAKEFNSCLKALPFYQETQTPRVEFLDCSVLLLEDFAFPGNWRGVLLEKMLETDRFRWTKWNDNAGTVGDRVAHIPIDVDYEMARINGSVPDLGVIEEGDYDDEESDAEGEAEDGEGLSTTRHHQNSEIEPSEYLQAFTHFTYLFTNKKVMVCDLQGVYNDHIVPPTFQLTDPAIHYRSTKREMVFGRTDKGQKGMQLFFSTHKCTPICKFLSLTGKNKQWRKQWHQGTAFTNVGP